MPGALELQGARIRLDELEESVGRHAFLVVVGHDHDPVEDTANRRDLLALLVDDVDAQQAGFAPVGVIPVRAAGAAASGLVHPQSGAPSIHAHDHAWPREFVRVERSLFGQLLEPLGALLEGLLAGTFQKGLESTQGPVQPPALEQLAGGLMGVTGGERPLQAVLQDRGGFELAMDEVDTQRLERGEATLAGLAPVS